MTLEIPEIVSEVPVASATARLFRNASIGNGLQPLQSLTSLDFYSTKCRGLFDRVLGCLSLQLVSL